MCLLLIIITASVLHSCEQMIQRNVNVVYAVKQKFSEEGIGLCEKMALQPISELFTTDGG